MTDTASSTPTAPLSLAEQISSTVAGMIGVHRLGTPVSRLATAVLRDAGRAEGVRVAEADGAAGARGAVLIEVALVAEYPARIDALCRAVREQVARVASEHGRALDGVDVDVVDVHGPFDPVAGEEPADRAADVEEVDERAVIAETPADAEAAHDAVEGDPEAGDSPEVGR